MRRFYLLLLAALGYTYIYGQSEPQFTQYMYNRYLVNPAFSGSEDALEVYLLHRSQYVSLASRFIATQGFNINVPFYAASSGVGLTLVNDLIGYQRSTYIALDYNYRKTFKWGKMGIGIGAGIIQTSLDGGQLRAPEGVYQDGVVNHNDDLLPNSLQQGVAPDLSFGLYFNNEKYFAGAAINHIAFSSARISTAAGNTKLNFSQNVFFTGGYDFKINNKLNLMPSAVVKSDLKKVQADLSATFTIIDNILAGISFRGYTKKTIDALAMVLGFRYKGFQVVYSYDANVSYLTAFNTGSHEISLSYKYPLKRKENRGYFYYNPRFNL
jgi:type IX secretion system PorP/SprF family membrane protein